MPGNISGFDSLCVVVHFTGRNSVLFMPWKSAEQKFYSQSLIASQATIIGIGMKDQKLQAAITSVSLQDNQSVTLNFSEMSEAKLKEKLAQLH